MACKNCSAEVADGAKFCPSCGNAIDDASSAVEKEEKKQLSLAESIGYLVFGIALIWWMSGGSFFGNSASAEEVCQETSELLVKHQGRGFTDTAFVTCVRLGPDEAQAQQDEMREYYEK